MPSSVSESAPMRSTVGSHSGASSDRRVPPPASIHRLATRSDLAFDREVVAECHKVDRYGRRVCSVVVAGVDVCLDQLRVGLAWVFTRYAHELPVSRRAAYVDAESAARGE